MPLRGLVHFDAFGAFCPDALVHFGSGIEVQIIYIYVFFPTIPFLEKSAHQFCTGNWYSVGSGNELQEWKSW